MNLEQLIDRHAEEVVALTQKLIKYPSINKPPYGQEGACQKYIASWLKKVCDKVEIFEPNSPRVTIMAPARLSKVVLFNPVLVMISSNS